MEDKDDIKPAEKIQNTFIKAPDEDLKMWVKSDENTIHVTTSDRKEYWFNRAGILRKAIKNGKKQDKGVILWFNEHGEVVHSKSPDGQELWFDDEMRVIHEKAADGTGWWYYYRPSGELEKIINSLGEQFTFSEKYYSEE